MEQFAQWFINLFKNMMENIWLFIKTICLAIYKFIVIDLVTYATDFVAYSKSFTGLDWFVAIIALILLGVLIAMIIVLLFQVIRRYFKFSKKELDKETLMYQVNQLNLDISQLVEEKNAVVAMSNVSSEKIEGQGTTGTKQKTLPGKLRFPMLTHIDEIYRKNVQKTIEAEKIDLATLTQRFIDFSASQLGLYYSTKVVARFFAALGTTKTIILEGISGTGKTSLPYAMGKFFKNDAKIISVQPSWRDRTEMVGYLNEFTKKFNETDFLAAIYEASYQKSLNFIVLDEMNLSRIEYYFADFLSMLEMPDPSEWKIGLVPTQQKNDPVKIVDGKFTVPQNIWFIGTANNDDSTYMITDKVYDRVISLEMNQKATITESEKADPIDFSFTDLTKQFDQAVLTNELSEQLLHKLEMLDEYIMDKFNIAFGNRIIKQLKQFIPIYEACGGDPLDGLDFIVNRKIIRKFETLNLSFMKKELEAFITYLQKLFGKHAFLECRQTLAKFIKTY